MLKNEYEFYEKIKNWDFTKINSETEYLTTWNMYDILKNISNKKSRILDLGTGGGEKVLNNFPNVFEIMGTDFSDEMIKTAKKNLKTCGKKNISFRVMDNLHMNTPDNYYDIVVARHTCIDPTQIYKTLKNNGTLIVRGVDKLDCWQLKLLFKRGQAYDDIKSISFIDYENIINAGFKDIELVPIYCREYLKTKEDLIILLLKTPIIDEFSKLPNDMNLLNNYIQQNTSDKGILLQRMYYGIVAKK